MLASNPGMEEAEAGGSPSYRRRAAANGWGLAAGKVPAVRVRL